MTSPNTPTRRHFLQSSAALTLGSLLAPGVFAQNTPPAAPPAPPASAAKAVGAPTALETIRLEDDLHVIAGAGGNISVHLVADSLLVIDAGLPGRVTDVTAAISKLAPNPARKILLNTHWHFDHVGANESLAGSGYSLFASTACRSRMGETINFEDLGMTVQPLPESARPTITFDESLRFHSPSTIRLTKIPPAHTDTDVIAFFEKYNILQSGDLFFNGAFPVIDRSTGGSLDGMIAATTQLLSLITPATRIIPGHGPIGTKQDLESQLDLLREVQQKLAPLGEKKTPMDEVLKQAPLAYLDDKWGRGFLRSPLFTKMAYGQYLTR